MAQQGKITIVDVRKALAGDEDGPAIDPLSTNARKIRDIIGRGSMATIQKHLMSIRDVAAGASEAGERGDCTQTTARCRGGALGSGWKP